MYNYFYCKIWGTSFQLLIDGLDAFPTKVLQKRLIRISILSHQNTERGSRTRTYMLRTRDLECQDLGFVVFTSLYLCTNSD